MKPSTSGSEGSQKGTLPQSPLSESPLEILGGLAKTVSGHCLEMTRGGSAMDSNGAAPQNAGIWHAKVKLVALKAETEAVSISVATEGA